jgi:PhoH-like ATPase
MAKKNLIIDTNVFLSDSECFEKFENNDLFVPIKVLEELDKHKTRQDSVGFHARQSIRKLDSLRSSGSLSTGVKLGKGLGILRFVKAEESFLDILPKGLSHKSSDNLILAAALAIKEEQPKRKCIVVSQDVNMRVIADAIGLLTEDYVSSSVVKSRDVIYEGFEKFLVDDFMVDEFYAGESVWLHHEDAAEQGITLYPNQFVMLVSVENEKKTAIARFTEWMKPLKPLVKREDNLSWGVSPRNKEQKCGMDLLMDNDIPFVSLIGRAGSGKTLMAMAAGLEQVLGLEKAVTKRLLFLVPFSHWEKTLVSCPGQWKKRWLHG